jgi:2-polyprenyl-3-methyl-5-hydroxy-6-metoxy-1,4-benzoquinol methylase
MTVEEDAALEALLAERSETKAVVRAVLAVWPEHASYLLKSFRSRTPRMLDTTEAAAVASRKLMAGEDSRFATDYRWTCDRLRDEELFFHREGRYRLSTFAEALAEVYSNDDYMSRYMSGLLLTQVLWYNHVALLDMFLGNLLGATNARFDYLEVGPGHGLMIYFAAAHPLANALEGWDVSSVSLAQTRAALDRLGVVKPVSLVETDILQVHSSPRRYDLVVISEVLEHLENPGDALRLLRTAISDQGRIYVNVPINSPSPDHLYLLSSPRNVEELITGAGFRIEEMQLHATQGRSIESALANRVSVSAGVIARPS